MGTFFILLIETTTYEITHMYKASKGFKMNEKIK